MITARNLRKSYGDYEALRGLECDIAAGEFVAIMGDSGSGKTTFLNLLAGLDQADSGELKIFDEEPARLDQKRLLDYRRRNVAMVFQDFNLLPTLNVLENVTLPIMLRGTAYNRAIEISAHKILERVGLDRQIKKLPETLSGGEMQRVSIARALCLQPRILLADEPTGSLDSRNSKDILDLLAEINSDMGLSIIMVTHSGDAAERAGRKLRIEDGRFL